VRRTARRVIAGALAIVTAGTGMAMGAALPAAAATVYEITGEWEAGTPATVGRGDVVNAVWRVNVNDDAPAPANDPVDNVTFTVTLGHGLFREIPDVCKTAGVDPVSVISEDARTLTCNLGTVVQGTAVVVQTPVLVDGATGEQITAVAEINGQQKPLTPINIVNDFAMDMQFGGNTTYVRWNSGYSAVDLDMQWALRLGAGSDPGPQTVTHRLRLIDSNGAAVSVGTGIYGDVGCSPFNANRATGVPWSNLPNYPANQQTSFVDSCTLTPVAGQPGVFDLTLRGINYDLSTVPTKDSAGNPLPADWNYIASGSVWFRVTTNRSGSLTLQSNAPTYRSTTGLTSTDLTANNSTDKTYNLPGGWSAAWYRPATGDGGTNWDTSYRLSRGETPMQFINYYGASANIPATTRQGQCLVFDTAYVTYTPRTDAPYAQVRALNPFTPGRDEKFANPPTVEYYTGAVADPDTFDCGTNPASWTSTQPANLSTVKAIRILHPHSLYAAEGVGAIQLNAWTTIKDTAPIEQDVWMFGSVFNGTSWLRTHTVQRDMPDDARYPNTTGRRDVFRVVYATPAIQKKVDRSVVRPGEPATFTLTYSANGISAPDTVDGYAITDTLPVGMSYVAGSASSAPAVSTNGSGQQVLTWSLNGVPTNALQTLTYQAVAADSVQPGQVLTNSATSSLGGQTAGPARAQVTVSTSGNTLLAKTTDQWFIANPDGSGDGTGSWTVTLKSEDPLPQAFTDTIDILPFNGDGRGTDFEGTYTVTSVQAPAGARVYYTTADPATLSDDPNDRVNGAPNAPSAIWTTTKPANPTAIRVIGGRLDPGTTSAFTINIATDGAEPGDVWMNSAQAVAEHTALVMRTSEPLTMGTYYSASLKKYVQDRDGNWVDANDPAEYPAFKVGDTVRYRIQIKNTGQGTLRNVRIADDKQPELGAFVIDELAPEEVQTHEYEITLEEGGLDQVVNTASATTDPPRDAKEPPTIPPDPAGFVVDGEPTHTKELRSATPVGDGRWELVYDIDVENASTHPTSYSLEDDLAFTDQATVVSAQVTDAPDGVTLADPAWDGAANPRIATNVPLAGNDDPGYGVHHYEVTVVAEVPLQLDGAGSGAGDPTQCGAEDDRSDRAFANHSALRDATGEVERDRACAPIPSIEITKGVSQGPTPNGDGTWTVVYDITATNDGAADGVYDMTDRMTADGDLTVESGEVVSAPEGVDPLDTWTGFGPDQTSPENVIAEGVTLPAGASHTYQVEVVLGIADGTEGAPVITPCSALGAGPGGLSNTAQVEHNGLTADDDACVTIAYITVDKSVAAGPTPNGDGTYTVVYDIVAENVGGDTGEYEVTDRLHFGDGIEILDAAVTAPDGVDTNADWTGLGDEGADENVVASGVELAVGQEHTYQVTVRVQMDEATIDPAVLACPPPGSDEAGGLGNSTSLDHNGIVAIDEVCPSLPLIRFAKAISDDPSPIGDGQWAITYDLTAQNVGQAAGDYDLVDELRYGAGIVIGSADVVTTPDGVDANQSWTGVDDTTVASGVELEQGVTHTYQVRVVVSLDRETVTPETLTCPEPGSGEPGGLANTGVLTHNGEDSDAEVCATLPLIGVDKTVSAGPTPNEDGTWTVVYDIVATNTGKADGTYDVVDRMETTGSAVAVESAEVITAPEGVDTNDAWTGQGAEGAAENVIASGIALGAGQSHTYQVRAVVSLADDAVGVPAVADCSTEAGQAGGLANGADVVSNGETVSDDACIKLADITVDKTVADGPTPNGDGTWTVAYDVVAENVGGAAGQYEVTDRLHFGEGIEIDSAKATGPNGIDVRDSWTGRGAEGADENVIASGVTLAAGASHTYRVTVVVELDEATIDPAALQCPPPGSGENGGLANSTTLTHNGITAEDEVCPSLPLIEFTKTISAGPDPIGEGQWQITYDLTATNTGQAAGEYDLVDQLRYGAGIDIASAKVITAPDGVETNAGWTGRGENTIATGVGLAKGATHNYQVQVVVSLDRDVVTPATLACPEPGSGEPGGLANTGVLTHNGEDTDDEVCATLPLIEVTKSLAGAVTPVEGEPGQYDAAYELTVTNRGPGAGVYDLADELAPGEGVEVVGIQDVATDVQGAELSESFDGLEDTRIVSDQPIAAATGGPVVHTYTVVVRYAVDLAEVDVPAGAQCTDGDTTVPGALNNVASVGWNGLTDADDECIRPGKPTLDKALVSADPVGEGRWEVVYDLTVGNVGAEATTYDLDDELLFAPVITPESVDVTGPQGVDLNPGFDGARDRRIATDVAIAGLDDAGYAPHVYRVTVLANVPLHFDAADVAEDGTGSPACTAPAGSNLSKQGLNNAATLTDDAGDQIVDTDCAPVPSIDITKVIDGDPTLKDGAWTVNYTIHVVNDGATAGAYDLVDQLRYGTGIQVKTATVTEAPKGVQVAEGWTGEGAEAAAENVIASRVQLAPATTHTYKVQVVATVDAAAVDASTWACPEPGTGEPGGFANTAGMGHNGLTDTAEACAAPDEPEGATPGGTLPKTGVMVGTLVGAAALLLLLGLLTVHAARRRTTS
jgi:uncharacterized repeat protein (TIGR01451 family)